MQMLSGVRDRLASELGREPNTWAVVEHVLAVVEQQILDGLVPGFDELSRAAVARGLPLDASAEELLAQERSSARIQAVQDSFDEMAGWRAEAMASGRTLAAVEHLLATLQSRPLAERPPVEQEAVRWLVERLAAALDPAAPHLEAALAAERARVAGFAAELSGLSGMPCLRWLAALNSAVAADIAPTPPREGTPWT